MSKIYLLLFVLFSIVNKQFNSVTAAYFVDDINIKADYKYGESVILAEIKGDYSPQIINVVWQIQIFKDGELIHEQNINPSGTAKFKYYPTQYGRYYARIIQCKRFLYVPWQYEYYESNQVVPYLYCKNARPDSSSVKVYSFIPGELFVVANVNGEGTILKVKDQGGSGGMDLPNFSGV